MGLGGQGPEKLADAPASGRLNSGRVTVQPKGELDPDLAPAELGIKVKALEDIEAQTNRIAATGCFQVIKSQSNLLA